MMLFRFFSARTLATGLAVSLLALASAASQADALQDANKLLKQGQHAQALDQVDKYLADKPKDAQGRFLKGLILTEMNKPTEAIAVFQKLTEDYPELPEPYNNLAVIYAQQKQYEKAKQALEMAIRTHPSYATAHENLGDIYSRMASQAYDKALQLDSSNTSAQTKLAMIRNLIGNARTNTAVAAVPTKPIAVAAADIKPAETKPAAVAPAVPTAPTATTKPITETKPIEPAKPAETRPATPEATKAPTKAANSTADVSKAVEAWAAAWSKKDVRTYLAHYARDFKTPNGEARSQWEAERSSRISKPGPIQVSVEGLKVSLEGDKATARFRQHYKSASLKTSSNKTLMLVQQDGKWLIQQEKVGN